MEGREDSGCPGRAGTGVWLREEAAVGDRVGSGWPGRAGGGRRGGGGARGRAPVGRAAWQMAHGRRPIFFTLSGVLPDGPRQMTYYFHIIFTLWRPGPGSHFGRRARGPARRPKCENHTKIIRNKCEINATPMRGVGLVAGLAGHQKPTEAEGKVHV